MAFLRVVVAVGDEVRLIFVILVGNAIQHVRVIEPELELGKAKTVHVGRVAKMESEMVRATDVRVGWAAWVDWSQRVEGFAARLVGAIIVVEHVVRAKPFPHRPVVVVKVADCSDATGIPGGKVVVREPA